MADWQTIKTEYITTDTSYRKLAEKYGLSRVQVSNVGKQEGWVELRRQFLADTLSKTLDAASTAEAQRAARILSVADKLLDRIEDVADHPKLTAKDIRSLTAAIHDLKVIQGIKSRLDQEEQEARIANLRRQADKDEDKVTELEIIFNAGPEEWNE